MSVNDEVEEHIHHAEGGFDKTVAGCMAGIAAVLAIVSLLGQHFNTEKLLIQQEASDMWAFYQAKDIRRYSAGIAQDLFAQTKEGSALAAKYGKDASRYRKETQEIQDKARDFEKERDKMGRQANAFHFGEVFLELAIVLSSLSILMKRRAFFYAGVVCALVGCAISLTGWLLYGVISKG
jgi:Domain of unknown function (DUF4337)